MQYVDIHREVMLSGIICNKKDALITKKLQVILGHESIRTTLDVYGHVLPNMQRDAMDRLNDFMAN